MRNAAAGGGFLIAFLLLSVSWLVPASTAGFFLAFLAVTSAVLPLAFGGKKLRIMAVVFVVLGVALAGLLANRSGKTMQPKTGRSPFCHTAASLMSEHANRFYSVNGTTQKLSVEQVADRLSGATLINED